MLLLSPEKKDEDHRNHPAVTPSHPMWKTHPPSGNGSAECMPTYLCVNKWEGCLNTTCNQELGNLKKSPKKCLLCHLEILIENI